VLGKLIARKVLKLLLAIRNVRSGQVKNNHEIGKWISFLSSLSNVNTIVEVGTWNGRGSSKSIVRGVKSRSKSERLTIRVIGYEINPKMVKSARKALKRYEFFQVIFGSIVATEDLNRANLTETEELWISQDEAWIKNSPNVLSTVPQDIDLLILDGGEFSTWAEFNILKNRVNGWIILDDTKTRKCSEILQSVEHERLFQLIYLSDERHGTAVLKKL